MSRFPKGTAAGGAEEAGKSLRVPGTNPFFPMLHDLQGNKIKLDKVPATTPNETVAPVTGTPQLRTGSNA